MQVATAVRTLAVVTAVVLVGCAGGGDPAPTSVPIGVDAGPVAASLYAYVLAEVNAMRFEGNPLAAALVRTAALDAYAQQGTAAFMATAVPHGHIATTPIEPSCPEPAIPVFGDEVPGNPLASCPGAVVRENQAFSTGGATERAVDLILASFLRESTLPVCAEERAHYEAIIDPRMNHVGIGLTVSTDGGLYLTLDFCD